MIARTILLLPLVGLAMNASTEGSARDAQKQLFNEITKTWKTRQERCESGIIRWKQDEFYEKEAYGVNDRVESNIVDYEFAFKQDGLCTYSLDGLRWNTDKKRFDHESFQNAIYNGDVKMLFAGNRHGRFPAGFICQRSSLEWGENHNFEIPILMFRPLAAGISWFRLSEWDVVSDSEVINGRRCIHLAKASEHLWLDNERGYLPMRHDWLYNNRLYGRLDAEYSPHKVAGWIPQTWRYVRTGYFDSSDRWHQKVTQGFTSRVTEFEVNVSIPDSKFDITFPPGTRIKNERTREVAIVREDGTIRPVDRAELLSSDRSWEEIMRSDPPSMINRRRRIRFWLLVGVGSACTVAIVFYLRHRTV